MPLYNWNIVESGVKYHNPNNNPTPVSTIFQLSRMTVLLTDETGLPGEKPANVPHVTAGYFSFLQQSNWLYDIAEILLKVELITINYNPTCIRSHGLLETSTRVVCYRYMFQKSKSISLSLSISYSMCIYIYLYTISGFLSQ
jgi:hypothetical protein